MTEDTDPDEFVVEELARRTGLTVRSIRSYQTRKLLPPPSMRSRTGYYGEHHIARIELIKDLQSQGMKLSSMARLLDDQSGSDADLLRFSRTLSTLFDERAQVLTTAADLQRRFDVDDDQAAGVLGKATELGLLRDLGNGLLEEVSPRLLAAGERAMETLHLDAQGALRVVEQLQRHSQAVTKIYIDLFTDRVWTPFADSRSSARPVAGDRGRPRRRAHPGYGGSGQQLRAGDVGRGERGLRPGDRAAAPSGTPRSAAQEFAALTLMARAAKTSDAFNAIAEPQRRSAFEFRVGGTWDFVMHTVSPATTRTPKGCATRPSRSTTRSRVASRPWTTSPPTSPRACRRQTSRGDQSP